MKTQRINVTFALKWMRRSPIYINASLFAQIIRDPASSTEEVRIKVMNLLQIAFPNNVLVSQFRGCNSVCSIDIYIYIYISRCLIISCFYGLRYVSHPAFLERSVNLWAHWLCVSTTASYTLLYLWIFIDYYGECEMADVSGAVE